MTLLEPDVALTDFALALISAGFVVWISRFTHGDGLRSAFLFLFGVVAVAALLGGITHGYLPNDDTPLYVTVWTGSLIAIGVAAFASWMLSSVRRVPAPEAQLQSGGSVSERLVSTLSPDVRGRDRALEAQQGLTENVCTGSALASWTRSPQRPLPQCGHIVLHPAGLRQQYLAVAAV